LIKVTLVCDTCDAVIADGISANEIRFHAKAVYHRRKYKDMCLICAGYSQTARRTPRPRVSRGLPSKKVDDVGR
jgi:hypothetical protein